MKLLPPPLSSVSSRVMSHVGVSVLLTSVQHFSDDFFFRVGSGPRVFGVQEEGARMNRT